MESWVDQTFGLPFWLASLCCRWLLLCQSRCMPTHENQRRLSAGGLRVTPVRDTIWADNEPGRLNRWIHRNNSPMIISQTLDICLACSQSLCALELVLCHFRRSETARQRATTTNRMLFLRSRMCLTRFRMTCASWKIRWHGRRCCGLHHGQRYADTLQSTALLQRLRPEGLSERPMSGVTGPYVVVRSFAASIRINAHAYLST